MKRNVVLALVVVGCSAALAAAGGPGGGGGGGTPAITSAEAEGLVFMREEEKLARDVYLYFESLYPVPIFGNIAESEQRHMDAILTLLLRYGLDDPALDKEPGEFTDPTLQSLYDQLVAQGSASLEDALAVGVLIEETDIEDLEANLLNVIHKDIRRVYENLLRGSRNHLSAFQSLLEGGVVPNGAAMTCGVVRTRGNARGPADENRGICGASRNRMRSCR